MTRVAILPEEDWLARAVFEGGGEPAPLEEAEALVWAQAGREPPSRVTEILSAHPRIRWIQLPSAGVEQYAAARVFDQDHLWTSAKGLYSRPVAEMALALALAGLRNLVRFSRATSWGTASGHTLYGAPVTIFGAGGIATELIELLRPFEAQVTVVRRHPDPVPGTLRVVEFSARAGALAGAAVVFLAHALTPETVGTIGREELELMASHTWVVNVGRGRQIVTEDLVAALRERRIGGAALDVTDPEPLPEGHPLWELPNCIVSPHSANPNWRGLLVDRVAENVSRYRQGQPLVGRIDPVLGY